MSDEEIRAGGDGHASDPLEELIGWMTLAGQLAAALPYCCRDLELNVEYRCERHPVSSQCPDVLVGRLSNGKFGLMIHDGGSSVLEIGFCPWCGTDLSTLPPGRRLAPRPGDIDI